MDEVYRGPVIVPMTVTNKQYYDELISKLRLEQVEVHHYILYANKSTLLKRLRKRFEYETSWAAQQIDRCLVAFQNEITEGIIQTDAMTIDEVVAYTSQFDFILGMRLHSLIMAHAVGVPMIGLSYDPKVASFLNEVKAPYCVDVDNLNVTRLKEYIDRLVDNFEEEKERIFKMNQKKERKVELPAEYIKQLLG